MADSEKKITALYSGTKSSKLSQNVYHKILKINPIITDDKNLRYSLILIYNAVTWNTWQQPIVFSSHSIHSLHRCLDLEMYPVCLICKILQSPNPG